MTKITSQEEATDFLNSLTTAGISPTPHTPAISNSSEISKTDSRNFFNNERIIDLVDNTILERLESWDMSMSIKDMLGLKAEAFKQNRLIEGKDDEINHSWIPSVINIQVINN